MLLPKRQKYRKQQRGSMKGVANRGIKLSFGEFGLQNMDTSWITAPQNEPWSPANMHYTQKSGRAWITNFAD